MATSSNLEYPISDTAVRTTIQNSGGISSTDTSFGVGEVTNVPTVPFLIAVWVKQSPLKEDDMEIMEVTSISGTTLTVKRGQKSTATRSFSDGDYVYMAVGSADLFDAVGAPTKIEDPLGDVIDPASNPEIRGGASLQTVVDAVEQSTLAQIAELEGASLQDVVDAVVDGALALAIDHPAETRVGLDVSSGVTIGPVPVQRAADIAVAANPTGGGDVSVTVDHTDADGNLFASDSPISGATSASKGTVPRHGTHVRIDLSGTDTSVNFHLDTHQ